MMFRMALAMVLGLAAVSAAEAQTREKQLEQFREQLQRDGKQARLALVKLTEDLLDAEIHVRLALANVTAAIKEEAAARAIMKAYEDGPGRKRVLSFEELAKITLTRSNYKVKVAEKQDATESKMQEFQARAIEYQRLVTALRKLTEKE